MTRRESFILIACKISLEPWSVNFGFKVACSLIVLSALSLRECMFPESNQFAASILIGTR